MSDHQQPCAELQVTKNEVNHLSEKIDDLHEDVKSYMGSVEAGQEMTAGLLRTNVDEQRVIRADILKSNELVKIQIESIIKISDERQKAFEKYEKENDRKMFHSDAKIWGLVAFILIMCIGTVWRVGNVTAETSVKKVEKSDTVMTRK